MGAFSFQWQLKTKLVFGVDEFKKMADSLFCLKPLNIKFSQGRVAMAKNQLVELYETCFE